MNGLLLPGSLLSGFPCPQGLLLRLLGGSGCVSLAVVVHEEFYGDRPDETYVPEYSEELAHRSDAIPGHYPVAVFYGFPRRVGGVIV